jgi:hypothetical protein
MMLLRRLLILVLYVISLIWIMMFQYQFILRNVWFASKYQIVHVQVSVKWPEFVVREGVHPSPPPHTFPEIFLYLLRKVKWWIKVKIWLKLNNLTIYCLLLIFMCCLSFNLIAFPSGTLLYINTHTNTQLYKIDVCDVTLSVHPHRASWKVSLATVGIEPATFGILVQISITV